MQVLQETLSVLALLAVVFTEGTVAGYCYNHQSDTYYARFKPTSCLKTCTVTPFFSPDTSLATYTQLIESATESIDIYTPGIVNYNYTGSVNL